MSTCPSCKHDNPIGSEFCDVCGTELDASSSAAPEPIAPAIFTPPSTPSPAPAPFTPPLITEPEAIDPPFSPPVPFTPPAPYTPSAPFTPPAPSIPSTTAKLVSKQAGSPIAEFILQDEVSIVGRFGTDTGPVEVDLEGFAGEDTVSRNHAEITQSGGNWKIQDLGSTNGVFIKCADQNRFGARITMPEMLNSGDEIAFGKVRLLFQTP